MKKLLLLLIFITSCYKEPVPEPFSFYYLTNSCLSVDFHDDTIILIGDESEYKQYCLCENSEKIDFSKYYLLGYKTTGQCTLNNIKDIYDDKELKRYIYNITVVDTGLCKSMVIDMNWVVITRFPENTYSIQVIINK